MVLYDCIWFWLCTIVSCRVWELKSKYSVRLHMQWTHSASQASPLPRLGPRLGNAGPAWVRSGVHKDTKPHIFQTHQLRSSRYLTFSLISTYLNSFFEHILHFVLYSWLDLKVRQESSWAWMQHLTPRGLWSFIQRPFRRWKRSKCKNSSVGQCWQLNTIPASWESLVSQLSWLPLSPPGLTPKVSHLIENCAWKDGASYALPGSVAKAGGSSGAFLSGATQCGVGAFFMAFYGITDHFTSFHIDHFFTLEQSMESWCQIGL